MTVTKEVGMGLRCLGFCHRLVSSFPLQQA